MQQKSAAGIRLQTFQLYGMLAFITLVVTMILEYLNRKTEYTEKICKVRNKYVSLQKTSMEEEHT